MRKREDGEIEMTGSRKVVIVIVSSGKSSYAANNRLWVM